MRWRPLKIDRLRTPGLNDQALPGLQDMVAHHLNFRVAADELALTQSAVSRQIQALEQNVGVALFLRHTRAVEITAAGAQLLRAVLPSLERIDSAVLHIRRSAERKSVTINTGDALQRGKDLAHFALIEASDAHPAQHIEWLTWRRWLDEHQCQKVEPKRWLYFNDAHQITQAALTVQGVALARMPMVADSLAAGSLVEVLPDMRLASPLVYWLIVGPRSGARAEIVAFCKRPQGQAVITRIAIGDWPDS